jgi:ferredoxin-type protein NapH
MRGIIMRRIRRISLFLMFLLLPVTLNYFSPYLIIDGIVHRTADGAFFIWTAMFVTSLVFGRAFCSYICPYGGLQMITDAVIQKPLREVNWLRKVKLVLGLVWASSIIGLLIGFKGFEKVDFFYLTETFVSVDNAMKLIGYYVIVAGLLILPLTLGKRGSCHYFCPMSILNITGTKIKNKINIPSLRLISDKSKCTVCKQCNKACPMSLDVASMVNNEKMENTECILCRECSNACRAGAVKRFYGKKGTCGSSYYTVKDKSV